MSSSVEAQLFHTRLPITAVTPAWGIALPANPSPRIPVGRTSYWAEGGGIGAVLLAIPGVIFAASGCSDGDSGGESNCFGSVLGLGLLGAGVGFTIGALVGARFPRSD